MIQMRDPLEAEREKRRIAAEHGTGADLEAVVLPPAPTAEVSRRKWIVCIPGEPVRLIDRDTGR